MIGVYEGRDWNRHGKSRRPSLQTIRDLAELLDLLSDDEADYDHPGELLGMVSALQWAIGERTSDAMDEAIHAAQHLKSFGSEDLHKSEEADSTSDAMDNLVRQSEDLGLYDDDPDLSGTSMKYCSNVRICAEIGEGCLCSREERLAVRASHKSDGADND